MINSPKPGGEHSAPVRRPWLGGAWLAALFSAAQVISGQELPAGSHVNAVRQLGPGEAARAREVRLHGVVTALSGWKNSFFLQDETGGISVDRHDDAIVHSGDEVEVEGVTGPGLFAPIVIANRVTVKGRQPLPTARLVSYADLALGTQDSQWAKVRGIVHSVKISQTWGRQALIMAIDLGGGSITAQVHDFVPADFNYLVDGMVQVTGVVGTIFNEKRQFIGLRLFVPDTKYVELEDRAPPDPFGVATTSIQSLWRFGAQSSIHRVKIAATVTYQRIGHTLYLQSGDDGIAVQSSQTTAVKPGDRVEAIGFVAPGDYAPELRDAVFRRVAGGNPPSALPIVATKALATKDGFSYAPYDGMLVELEGEVVDTVWQAGEQIWLMRDHGTRFRAAMPQSAPAYRLAAIRPGSRLRLRGICITEADQDRVPTEFHVLLRSANDVVVLDTPWWTTGRLVLLFGLLTLATLGMLAWVVQLRRALPSTQPEVDRAESRRHAHFRSASKVAGIMAMCMGLTVLIAGWALDIARVRHLAMGYAPMKANVALSLLMAGCALWLRGDGHATLGRLRLSQLCASIVLLIGALTLVELTSGLNLHIDELLFRDQTGYSATVSPGRMAPLSALCFVFLGSALLLSQFRRAYAVSQAFVIAVGSVCLLTLVGYLYGITIFYGVAVHMGMAIHTAITLVALSCAVLFSTPDRGLMATILSDAPGGAVARGLLPAALLIPAGLGWLQWHGQLAGLYDATFGAALFASATIVVFAMLTCICATLLNRLDVHRTRAEADLRDSEERHRMVVESLPQMVWTCTQDGRCDYLSRQWLEYTGVPEEEQLGFGWTAQVHPDDRARMMEVWHAASTAGKNFDAEYRIAGRAGAYRWFRALAVPVHNAVGAVIKWFGTSTDIQDVKTAEAALRTSEARFRELADAMPQMVWTAGPDGAVDYYNRRWYEYTGMPYDQSKDWGWQNVLHTDDVHDCLERWTYSVTTGDPYDIEYRLKRVADGVYRWHLGRAVPILDSQGKIVRWFGTCTDIEEYKQAEREIRNLNDTLEARVQERTAALRESEERFRSLIEGIRDYAIVRLDPQGNVASWNIGAQRIQGFSAGEIVGKHFSCFYTEEDIRRRHPEELLAIARERGQADEEGLRVRRDGSRYWASMLITALYDDSGGIRGFSEITRDITERMQAQQELVAARERAEAANRAKSAFLAAMSHEIRTPMNAILGMADVLWESDLSVDQRQYVEVFRRAGSNLLTLINDILDLSRIEAGHFELEHVEFDLEEVVDQAMELVGPKARSKGIAILSRLAPGLNTAMMGDPTRLRQILINLLGNAVKFTESGEIVLSVRNDKSGQPGRIDFAVSDTGIGIAPDKLAVIFDDFTQADSSTTRRYGGSGLGLGISRRLVEAMGGRLTASSSLGTGSTFQFTALFESLRRANRQLPTTVEDFSGRRVMVIDDNATNRLILGETLETWGLLSDEFEVPEQGVAALAAATSAGQPYSLVILDNQMPQVGGFEVAGQIRQLNSKIPMIMLASETHLGDAERRRKAGLAGYAVKPVKRADLLRLIYTALATQQQHEPRSEAMPFENNHEKPDSGLKILVAEDSPDNRLLVQVYLKGSPHALTFAEDGQAAVDKFVTGGFDLIFMDIQMPVMDGLTATRTIRAAEQQNGLAPIPIIALTANARPEDIRASQDAGCNVHLSKPISKQRLLTVIDEQRSVLRVQIPEGFEELTPGYLAARRNDLAAMTQLLADSDFDQLRILGHNMKGNGTSYGFPDLTRIGASLEASAREKNGESLRNNINELADYLGKVQLVEA